jgi:uncharacterized protein
MPSLTETLSADLKDAMRAGDAVRRDEIRGLLAALKAESQAKLTRALAAQGLIVQGEEASLTPEQQAAVERVRASAGLSPEEEQAVLQQRAKQHRQAIDSFRAGRRADLEAAEAAQLAVLQRYLPQALDADAVEAAIRAAISATGASGPREQGKVMAALSPQLRGRADLRAVSARVQELLSEVEGRR